MAKDYLIAALAQVLAALSAASVAITVARLLGPTGRGEYALLAGAVLLLALCGQLGFVPGAIQMGSRGAVAIASLFRYAGAVSLAGGVGGIAVLVGVAWRWPAVLGAPTILALGAAAAALPLLMAGQLHGSLLLALQQPTLYHRLVIVQQLSWAAGVASVLLISPSPASALAAWAASMLVWFLAVHRHLRRRVGASHPAFRWQELARVLFFGAQSTAGLLMLSATRSLGLFIVSANLGTAQAGIYSIATILSETVWQAVSAISRVNLARASSAYAQGETPTDVLLANRLVTALTVAGSIGVAVAAPALIRALFGEEFVSAASPLRVLLAGTAVYTVCMLLSGDLLARGYPNLGSLGAGITLAVSLPLYLLLVPRWDLVGAAASTATAYFVATAALVWLHRRITGSSPADFVMPRRADALAAWRSITRLVRRAVPREG